MAERRISNKLIYNEIQYHNTYRSRNAEPRQGHGMCEIAPITGLKRQA